MSETVLSVVIVNWKTRDPLHDCLQSILQSDNSSSVEVIVVDNASRDGSADMVKAEFPGVQLVENEANVGFAAACNQGLSLSQGRYVMLLNPDTLVVGDALEKLIRYMDSHPDVGLVCPQLFDAEGAVWQSCFAYPSLLNSFFEATLLFRLFPNSSLFGQYRLAGWSHNREREVDWAVGAALLARREAAEHVGPLDEAYFMYSEDTDWCRRFHKLGWRVMFFPDAKVIHLGNRAAGQQPDAMKPEWIRSRVRYARAHDGVAGAWLTRIMFGLGYLLRVILWSGAWLVTRGGRRAHARQRIQQWWPAFRWCLVGDRAAMTARQS